MQWMKSVPALGLGILCLLAATGGALAEIESNTHEAHLYAGWMFGGDLTERAISGDTPALDDDLVVGLRYQYNFNQAWGIETSVGYSPSSVTDVAGSDIDMNLMTFDVDALWHIRPEGKVVPHLAVGLGYAQADLDQPITGKAGGKKVTIDDDGGMTANVGVGLAWFATEHLIVRGDARYRYVDKLLDELDDAVNTVDTTVGVGWRF